MHWALGWLYRLREWRGWTFARGSSVCLGKDSHILRWMLVLKHISAKGSANSRHAGEQCSIGAPRFSKNSGLKRGVPSAGLRGEASPKCSEAVEGKEAGGELAALVALFAAVVLCSGEEFVESLADNVETARKRLQLALWSLDASFKAAAHVLQ